MADDIRRIEPSVQHDHCRAVEDELQAGFERVMDRLERMSPEEIAALKAETEQQLAELVRAKLAETSEAELLERIFAEAEEPCGSRLPGLPYGPHTSCVRGSGHTGDHRAETGECWPPACKDCETTEDLRITAINGEDGGVRDEHVCQACDPDDRLEVTEDELETGFQKIMYSFEPATPEEIAALKALSAPTWEVSFASCVGCWQTTREPVPVRDLERASGPCVTQYACPDCAPGLMSPDRAWRLVLDHATACAACRYANILCAVGRTLDGVHKAARRRARA